MRVHQVLDSSLIFGLAFSHRVFSPYHYHCLLRFQLLRGPDEKRIRRSLTLGRIVSFHMLWANIEAAESTEESAEDITAAETAPRPEEGRRSEGDRAL